MTLGEFRKITKDLNEDHIIGLNAYGVGKIPAYEAEPFIDLIIEATVIYTFHVQPKSNKTGESKQHGI